VVLAEDGSGPLFVQGTTRNQVVFYPLFDHIVLLSAPRDVLVERTTAGIVRAAIAGSSSSSNPIPLNGARVLRAALAGGTGTINRGAAE
jgi:hypothetical protein